MNIKNISEKIIRYISKEKKLSSKQVLLYCYTLQMLLELVLSTTITLVLAACCNKMQITIYFLLFFAFLRIYAGGIHLKKYWQCCILSNLVIFIGVFIVDNMKLNYVWTIFFSIILNLTAIAYALLKGSNSEKKFFLKKIIRNELIMTIISVIYIIQKQYWILYVVFSANLMVVIGCIVEGIKGMRDKRKNKWSYN